MSNYKKESSLVCDIRTHQIQKWTYDNYMCVLTLE